MNLDAEICTQIQDMTPRPPQTGFSLVELMIALTIGLIIVAAVGAIFVRSRSTYQLDEGLARVQENARFAMDYLAKDLRMAGYLGCNSRLFAESAVNNIAKPSTYQPWIFSPGGLLGYRYNCTTACSGGLSEWQPALPGDFFTAGEVKVGSDVVIINRGSELDTSLTGNLTSDNAEIAILATTAIAGEINAGDALLISDCTAADIFRATTVSSGGGGSGKTQIAHAANMNTTPKLSKLYGTDARLMKLITRAYYIKTNETSGEPGLYRKELGSGGVLTTGEELVGGVESMKILYGEEKDGKVQFVEPSSVTDWTKVTSARLGIIVRTPGTADTDLDTKTYDLLDDTVSGLDDFNPEDDRRRRRVFNDTIRIRNR